MRVLGIDPGTAALGYGIVDRTSGNLRAVDFGVVTTEPSAGLPARLLAIQERLEALIEAHSPDLVGVERLFFSRNAQTAFAIGQARGVVLVAAARSGVPVREATPSEVKAAVAGHGAAGKAEVARMAALILGMAEPPTPDDAADALAVAICVANVEVNRERRTAGPLDLATLEPREEAARSPYERAVAEAVEAERRSKRRSGAGAESSSGRSAAGAPARRPA